MRARVRKIQCFMKKILNFFNDLSDKRHVKRLFKKYEKDNFESCIKEIKTRVEYTNQEKRLLEYYYDLKYLRSAERVFAQREIEEKEHMDALRSNILAL